MELKGRQRNRGFHVHVYMHIKTMDVCMYICMICMYVCACNSVNEPNANSECA